MTSARRRARNLMIGVVFSGAVAGACSAGSGTTVQSGKAGVSTTTSTGTSTTASTSPATTSP